MKKLLSLILCLSFLFVICPAKADDEVTIVEDPVFFDELGITNDQWLYDDYSRAMFAIFAAFEVTEVSDRGYAVDWDADHYVSRYGDTLVASVFVDYGFYICIFWDGTTMAYGEVTPEASENHYDALKGICDEVYRIDPEDIRDAAHDLIDILYDGGDEA